MPGCSTPARRTEPRSHPAYERVGEILTVDKWVIDHALELIGRGAQTSHYQVNISGKSLADPGLLTYVTEAIRRHGVKPECLTFEITETTLIENRNEALAFATGIREIGCHLALDDFGTGYGALAHLKYFAQGYKTGRPEPIAVSPERPVRTIEIELRLPPQHTAMG